MSNLPVDLPLVSLVIPLYNEENSIGQLFAELDSVITRLVHYTFEIVCVNDASNDDTLSHLLAESKRRSNLIVVDLSRNFGKEGALSAGLQTASGDAVIPIDADLQDPPDVIEGMLEQWKQGFEVVLAKRIDRSTDTAFKRTAAGLFYRLHNLLADISLPENVGDFRLLDRIAVDALNRLPENCRFMKGLFAWIGFRTTTITYRRATRSTGGSRFKLRQLINLAAEGITSFSVLPLRMSAYLGVFIACAAVVWASWIALRTLVWGVDLPGYASIFVAILFLGGIQLVSIGILGEYIGRTYMESKRRPAYVIRRIYASGARMIPIEVMQSVEPRA
jgi:glycosyltransferase involved in cell wall biosynthesis